MKRRTDHRLTNLAQRLDRAAELKPQLDAHQAQQLAYCDTRQHNETGISSGNTISDPVIAAIMSRAHVIDKSNAVEAAMVALEAAVNGLDTAMRRAWGDARPAPPNDAPVCYVAGCTAEVSSTLRADGSTSFRMGGDLGGMCDSHRMESARSRETEARRQRRHRSET